MKISIDQFYECQVIEKLADGAYGGGGSTGFFTRREGTNNRLSLRYSSASLKKMKRERIKLVWEVTRISVEEPRAVSPHGRNAMVAFVVPCGKAVIGGC